MGCIDKQYAFPPTQQNKTLLFFFQSFRACTLQGLDLNRCPDGGFRGRKSGRILLMGKIPGGCRDQACNVIWREVRKDVCGRVDGSGRVIQKMPEGT